jgi:hypothetical protein
MTGPAHIRLHLRFASLLATCMLVLVCAASAQAATESGSDSVGFGVSPLRFDLEAKPGASLVEQVRITNTDDRPGTFTFSREDFEGDKVDPAATPILLGGKFASDISGYDWLSTPDAVTIPAGQTRTVNVRIDVPSDATGGHYAALIVTGPARSADALVAQSRMGVLFLMNAGGVPPPDIVITEVTQVGPTKTVTKYINKGKTHVTPTPSVVTDPRGPGGTTRTNGTCTTAPPGAAGTCTVTTPGTTAGEGGFAGLPPEKRIDLVTPDGSRATEGLPTEWASAWSSMLLPLVGIALFATYFLFLRRRKDDDAPEDEFELYAS